MARCFQRADVERPCIAHVEMHLVWIEPYVQLRRTKLADQCELSDRHVDGERRHPWGSRARDVCVCPIRLVRLYPYARAELSTLMVLTWLDFLGANDCT